MVFMPDGTASATYDKHPLTPGFEHQHTSKLDYRMLDGTLRTGLAIRKDMDFHDIGRAYAACGARLLLVPAWNFGIDGWLHSRMAIMRGVESGFAIARAACSGRLTLGDDRGRVVANASGERHDAELPGNLSLHHNPALLALGRLVRGRTGVAVAARMAAGAQAVSRPAISHRHPRHACSATTRNDSSPAAASPRCRSCPPRPADGSGSYRDGPGRLG